jgi:Holliday junction resolvase RusA-like endonuclease
MTDSVTISHVGVPVAKERARRGRNGHFYTPARTRAYERELAWEARIQMGAVEPLRGPLVAWLTVEVPIPQSWSKAKRMRAIAHDIAPSGRPDATNYAKTVEDAVNGILYGDDAQIVRYAHLSKVYSEQPKIVFTVKPENGA